jgi:large subunit ribosomal protein L18
VNIMAKKITMQYRRKREGRTDYKKRLVLLKSGLPRLVIRASNKSIQAQLVTYEADGDRVIATARATELSKHGWKSATGNIPAAYLTGVLLASKIKSKISDDVIVDIGLQKHHKGGRLYAVAKGAMDAGLNVRVGEEVLPTQERINGSHIDESVGKTIDHVKKTIMK